MYDLMIYSLKVGVCLAVFYLFFKLLLSRETFHRFNRIVVLGAMFLRKTRTTVCNWLIRWLYMSKDRCHLQSVTSSRQHRNKTFPWQNNTG